MKKLLILAVSLVVSGIVFAHGPGRGPFSGNNTEYRQQMDRWHDVMHSISVNSVNVTDGILLKVSTDSDEILKTMKQDLRINEKGLSKFFKDVDVSVKEGKKGFEINLTSDDSRTVSRLQNWKNGLFFQYVQNQMHGRFGERMGYGGHMGGCNGGGRGFGPGMMQGNYNHMGGYNSGMMGTDQPMM